MKTYKFRIGVFCNGVLIFQIGNKFTATHSQASFIIDLFSTEKLLNSLEKNHYLAYDYV